MKMHAKEKAWVLPMVMHGGSGEVKGILKQAHPWKGRA
jgi:fructose/tagatose bisphosphate aldolase